MTAAGLVTPMRIPALPELQPSVLLTKRNAQALDTKIRAQHKRIHDSLEKTENEVTALLTLLDEAATGQIHVALELPSWAAYVKEAVHFEPNDRFERKAVVSLMSGRGLSQRAIAGVLGVSQKTVDRDLEGQKFETATVTSLNGKRVARNKEVIDAEVVEEFEPTAAGLVEDFGAEIDGLQINVQAFKDIVDDELFAPARKRIAQRFAKRLSVAVIDLGRILDEVMGE